MNKQPSLIAWVNGSFTPLAEAHVHIEDRGFQFADGVYEVIACFGGTFVDLDEHLQRLWRSCREIELSPPLSISELTELIHETYRRNPFDDAMLYIQLTRGVAPRSHVISKEITPTLIITARQLPAPSEDKISLGSSAITLPDIRWTRCDIKSISLLASVLGKQEASRRHVDETFWLDDEDHVLEGCSTNCFAVIGGALITHPLDRHVLEGITRKMVIRLAHKHGLEMVERPWRLIEDDITEIFMTSTTNAAMPVCLINDRPVGDGRPGPVTLRIRGLLLDHFRELRS